MATLTLPRSIPLLMSRQLRPEANDNIQAQFLQFHKDNPSVYEMLVKLARQVKATGREKYGIENLFARMRWHFEFESKSGDGFKLNNNMRSRYARLIMQTEPDLKGFFNTRQICKSRGRQVARD